ncbi:MAG: YajG family lipoprotein [Rhodospirillaceae bacterium]
MMRLFNFILTVIVAFLISSCSTTPVPLTYDPHGVSLAGPTGKPVLEVATVDDRRKVDANWLGAIRGGYGNPLKKLESNQPVSKVVKTVFQDGLKARGLQADSGKEKFALEIIINKLDCSQLVRREAHVDLDVKLISLPDQRKLLEYPVQVNRVNGSIITFDAGIFASVEDLRQIMNDTLQEAVDKALDNTGLRSHLNGRDAF